MIPLAIPNISGNEGAYLQECVDSTFVSTVGPFVNRFEEMVTAATGAAGCVATSAGTTGLHAGLVSLGVKANDLVIAPSLTFVASCNAIAHAGATPWLIDVDANSWTLDPVSLAEALESETQRRGEILVHVESGRRVAAILPVYALGMPADMDPILEIARQYGLPVMADGAAALGATYKDRRLGEIVADLTMFSFNGNKTFTAGGGGAVIGSDEAVVKWLRHLTTTARVGADYNHDVVGFNYRMTNIQAAVGCAQLERYEEFVSAKQRIDALYRTELSGMEGVHGFPQPDWAQSACWFSGIILDECDEARSMSLRTALREHGVDARPFWKPMHFLAPFADAPRSTMPVTDSLWTRILTLPCSTQLTEDEQSTVIQAMKTVLKTS